MNRISRKKKIVDTSVKTLSVSDDKGGPQRQSSKRFSISQSAGQTPPPVVAPELAGVRPEKTVATKSPSGLENHKFNFIIDNGDSQFALWEYFKFSGNTNFSLGINPFEHLSEKNPCDYFICFCEEPLGPLLPGAFSNAICSRMGKKKVEEIEKIVQRKYFGEVPVNTVLEVKGPEGINLLFVTIDKDHPLCAYQSFRVALLHILHNTKKQYRSGTSSSGASRTATKVEARTGSIHIPEVFQTNGSAAASADAVTAPKLKSKESTTTTGASSSSATLSNSGNGTSSSSNFQAKATSTASVEGFKISVLLLDSFKELAPEETVFQMARAYEKLLYVKDFTHIVDREKFDQRYRQMCEFQVSSLAEKQKKFIQVIKRNDLVRRGLINNQEAEWLLGWVADTTNLPMQLAATVALADYILTEKSSSLPINVSPKEVLDRVFTSKDQCLKCILQLAEDGAVSLHRAISIDQIKKKDTIGKGATATVFSAEYEGRIVAFKEFIEGTSMSEFRKEVAMMSLLKHPCLVNIIGAGSSGNIPYLVSEFVSKGALYDLLHEGPKTPIPEPTIIQWALDIACGMQYLHSLGVIHRDLKSLNVLVTSDDHCKIIDYGASRIADNSNNMTGNIGTVSWMAPEMFQTTSYTPKIDVYSFAIVLFELVVREIPFAGENSFSLPVQVTKGLRPKLPKTLSKQWSKLITQCWHAKPAKRPGFDTIIDTLEAYKHGKEHQ